MLPYSLLFQPLRNHLRWVQPPWSWSEPLSPANAPQWTPYTFRAGGYWQPSHIWLQPALVDPPVATPDAPPWTQYAYRPGGYWQPQKAVFWPVPPDLAVPGPLYTPYVFRPGGYYQPQKRWGVQPPADNAFSNAPVLRPYAFRPGGLWRMSLSLSAGVPALVFTPYMPPLTGVPSGDFTGSSNPTLLGSPSGEFTGSSNPGLTGVPTQN